MKNYLLVLIFFTFLLPNSFSNIQGIVEPNENKKVNLLLGDSVDLKVSFWPKNLNLFEDIKKLEGKSFLNIFYVYDVYKFEISKNNYDVINIFIKAIALKPYEKVPFDIWSNGVKNIPIEIRKITIGDLRDREKEITYYSMGYSNLFYSYNIKFLLLGIVILVFMLTILFKGKRIKKFNN